MPEKNFISTRLDLEGFFYAARDQIYAVIKRPEIFPAYLIGSDIDVFCYDWETFGRTILEAARPYLDQGMEIQVREVVLGRQSHVDFYDQGMLHFRFDLYGALPAYQKANVKESLFYSVIENAQAEERNWGNNLYRFYFPSEVDEYLIRYLEYIEYYEQYPDKIKHLEYILKGVDGCPGRIRFIDKLHNYTDLPKCSDYRPADCSGTSNGLLFRRTHAWQVVRRLLPMPLKKILRRMVRFSGL